MALRSSIEWTECTWNPVTGCSKVSEGCRNCYAERMALRLKAMGKDRYRNGFRVTMQPDLVDLPSSWRQPRLIFVNSMSDLFHRDVPDEFIKDIFETMQMCPQHTFQVLTKRADRLAAISPSLPWADNIWMGVSIENSDHYDRIRLLATTPARVKFLSCEPLLGRLRRLPLSKIDWVIVGGESGPRARSMDRDWVAEIRDQCVGKTLPFFFKQWGGRNKKAAGRRLDGRLWDEMPPLTNQV